MALSVDNELPWAAFLENSLESTYLSQVRILDELKGPRGPGYQRMIEVSAVGRAGTPDEVGTAGALLMGPDGAFITGSGFLMDGGVTAAYRYGDPAPR